MLFAVRQNAFADAALAEGLAQLREVQAGHRRVGDDHEVLAANPRGEQIAIAQQPRADRNGIFRMSDIYLERLH